MMSRHPVRKRYRGLLTLPLFAALGVRPPVSQHTEAEGRMLQKYAASAGVIVEIGVAEGASAWEMRQVMPGDATLYLVDPFHLARWAVSAALLTARRLIHSVDRGHVVWVRDFSQKVGLTWSTPIDFLFIDGSHGNEAVRQDWEAWSPHLKAGAHVALHDAIGSAPPDSEWAGAIRLLERLRDDPDWKLVDSVDSLAVLRRVTHPRAKYPNH